MSSLKRAIELKPDPQTHSNVLMTINYHPGYSAADLLEAHRSWAELHELNRTKPTAGARMTTSAHQTASFALDMSLQIFGVTPSAIFSSRYSKTTITSNLKSLATHI